MPKTSLVILVALLAMLQTSVNGADCTSDEATTIDNVYSDLSNGTCASLISDTDATSVDYCQDSDCLSALSDVVDQLPDCTDEDAVNRKIGLQAIISYCTNVTTELDQSASTSTSGSTSGTDGSVVSAAATVNGVVATAVLSVATVVVAALL